MRVAITEKIILEKGFQDFGHGLFIKSTLTGKQVWGRCSSCGRFGLEPIMVKKEQDKVVLICSFEKGSDGAPNVKNHFHLPIRKIKVGVKNG